MSDWRSREPESLEERLERRERMTRPGRAERAAPKEEATLADLINDSVRKVVTAIVVAGALIGAGVYLGGDEVEAPRYQVTTTPDGRIIRLRTDNGTLVVCDGAGRCGILQRRSEDLEDDPPPSALPKEEARPALPAPAGATAPNNEAAAAPAAER